MANNWLEVRAGDIDFTSLWQGLTLLLPCPTYGEAHPHWPPT